MSVTVNISNADLGRSREVDDVTEQIGLLCTAIAHADQSVGFEVRALLRLAAILGGTALEGAEKLVNAAAVACHGVRIPAKEATATLADNMRLCAEVEAEQPRTS